MPTQTASRPGMNSFKVLYVEDNPKHHVLVQGFLAASTVSKFDLECVPTYDQGLERMAANDHHAYLVDFLLPSRDGLQLIREATGRGCHGPFIVLTGYGDPELDLEAMRVGAWDLLVKSQINPDILERAIRHAVQQWQAQDRIRELNAELEQRVQARTLALSQANESLHLEIRKRQAIEEEQTRTIEQLRTALAEVRVLSGLLPICAHCKRIRDDKGYWNQLENYITQRTAAQFTHGICPDCVRTFEKEWQK